MVIEVAETVLVKTRACISKVCPAVIGIIVEIEGMQLEPAGFAEVRDTR